MTVFERKPETEARSSQFVNSRRGIPVSEALLVMAYGEVRSPVASRKESVIDPICMLKSPWGLAYTC
jgi:hypothetical protein